MSDDETSWSEFGEFATVDLEQSFVVAWETDGESLMIDLDVVLWPEHAFYEEPRPAEGACFARLPSNFRYAHESPGRGKMLMTTWRKRSNH